MSDGHKPRNTQCTSVQIKRMVKGSVRAATTWCAVLQNNTTGWCDAAGPTQRSSFYNNGTFQGVFLLFYRMTGYRFLSIYSYIPVLMRHP